MCTCVSVCVCACVRRAVAAAWARAEPRCLATARHSAAAGLPAASHAVPQRALRTPYSLAGESPGASESGPRCPPCLCWLCLPAPSPYSTCRDIGGRSGLDSGTGPTAGAVPPSSGPPRALTRCTRRTRWVDARGVRRGRRSTAHGHGLVRAGRASSSVGASVPACQCAARLPRAARRAVSCRRYVRHSSALRQHPPASSPPCRVRPSCRRVHGAGGR